MHGERVYIILKLLNILPYSPVETTQVGVGVCVSECVSVCTCVCVCVHCKSDVRWFLNFLGWGLLHINTRLFNAKSIFIRMNSSILNNSV